MGRIVAGASWSGVLATGLLSLVALAGSARAAGGDAVFAEQFGDAFFARYWQWHPGDAIAAGYYVGAERLPAPDAKWRAGLQHYLETELAQVRAVDPGTLSALFKADHAILANQLESEIWELREAREWEWDPSSYNVADAFDLLLNTDYAPADARLRTVLARLDGVPAYYAAARASLGTPSLEHTRLAIEQNSGALDEFGPALQARIDASGLDAGERQRFARRLEAARKAIGGYVDWLRAREAELRASGKARSFRLGRDLYERRFAYQVAAGVSAQELFERAKAEKERLTARMELLTDLLWPRYFPDAAPPAERYERIGALIAKLSEQHAAPGALFDEVQRLLPELERWITEHDLVALDPSRPLQVRVTPPYKQGVAFASIDAPGPYNPEAATYFNVTPLDATDPEKAESALREYNRWMLPELVIHEAIPGHYVQLVHANKSPSRIKSVFGNGAMIEGWAVYAERMMYESGYGGETAEQWLMFSKFNLRAACNTLLDIGVHTLGWSQDEAMRLMTREAFQTPAQAAEKWHRLTVSSVQLTTYFAGYSAIVDLRERLKRSPAAEFDLKRFHEKFLSYGSAPVPLIAALMAQEARP